MTNIYAEDNVINAVQNILTSAWNKMGTTERALVKEKMKAANNPPTVAEVLTWGPFVNYDEDTVMRKALQSKVKSWFMREAKRLNKLTEQTVFAEVVEKKQSLRKERLQKKRVPHLGDGIYTNDDWSAGITKAAFTMVRYGLASFSTFAACFIYYKKEGDSAYETNYVVKLVNGADGTKVVKYVSI